MNKLKFLWLVLHQYGEGQTNTSATFIATETDSVLKLKDIYLSDASPIAVAEGDKVTGLLLTDPHTNENNFQSYNGIYPVMNKMTEKLFSRILNEGLVKTEYNTFSYVLTKAMVEKHKKNVAST